MPYLINRRLFVVFLSAFLGWMPVLEGRIDAPQRPSGTPAPAKPATPTQTAPVQAPPLQPSADAPAPGNPVVVMSTSLGDVTLELFKTEAPVSVQNFLQYVNEGFYSGTIFHRVKKGFMIQGGGFTPSLQEKPAHPPIQNEATNGLRNARGTLAMARTRALRSATSQFYINVVDNRMLDHTGFAPEDFGYAVFGRVLSGMDIVDKIVSVPTTSKGPMDDVPVDPVVIKSVKVVKTP
jgi:cyclophilin family peptidyl-prolyl cis-trans isomerase